jgi:hypothetical protein
MPDFAERHTLGQFDRRSFPIAWSTAQRTLSRHRQRRGIIDLYPKIEASGYDKDGFARIALVSVRSGAAPVAPAVFVELHDAITAALQQNRSTMTSISKPLPATLGQTELEIIELEDRLRKRKAKSRVLDERVQQLRSHAASLRYPSEPSGAERVISFRKRYEGPGAKVYVYAAIRVNGRWYTTGSTCPASGFTWRGLVDFIREDNQLVKEGFDLFELLHREPLPF